MPNTPPTRPPPTFTHHPSSSPFTISQAAYLQSHPSPNYNYIATGAIVFINDDRNTPRILLLQRSASDSMPHRWEIPGGGCDDTDPSIVSAVARELWEEAGLRARHIGPPVGEPYLFTSRSGKKICKYCFLVEAESDSAGGEQGNRLEVRLDPEEHQRFVWAGEAEVEARSMGGEEGLKLEFTTEELRDTILEALRQRRSSWKERSPA